MLVDLAIKQRSHGDVNVKGRLAALKRVANRESTQPITDRPKNLNLVERNKTSMSKFCQHERDCPLGPVRLLLLSLKKTAAMPHICRKAPGGSLGVNRCAE